MHTFEIYYINMEMTIEPQIQKIFLTYLRRLKIISPLVAKSHAGESLMGTARISKNSRKIY
jgi:hypothetical protein